MICHVFLILYLGENAKKIYLIKIISSQGREVGKRERKRESGDKRVEIEKVKAIFVIF